MTDQPFREKNRDRRIVLWTIVGLVVLFGGVYLAGYLFTGDRVPRGTTIAGVDVGGLRPAAAERRLSEELEPRATKPIMVTADGQKARVDPAEAGLSVDVAESVAQAGGGRSLRPGRMWDYFTGGDDYDAVVDVDDALLGEAIERVAADVDEPARNGRIRFRDGAVRTRSPRTGQQVDRDASARAVVDAYLEGDRPVRLAVERVEPEIDESDLSTALDDFANPAMSAPVVIELADEELELAPEDYSAALSMKPENGALVPALNDKRLLAALEPAMEETALTPQDATVRLVDGKPKVIPGKDGVTFDEEELTDQFLSLVVQRGANRRLAVESQVDEPEFDVADARDLKIQEVVSDYTTYYPHADYRNTNLGRAAELVNGTVLRPGETFSLNDTVGERTEENGFAEGFIISNGVYKEDFGGGVSQVATTLFNAAFFAGLEDVEHKPHSFYISRYPVGREATVAWGAVDLRFKNDTPYGVLIQAWIDPSNPSSQGAMNVRMWSTKHWDITAGVSDRYDLTSPETRRLEGDECVPNEGYGGFDVDVYRYFRKPGSDELVRKETMHTTYTPSDTVICG